jgi:crotonobetainyl-CoA:carnitine CoA-transferase CaiB-like acyl-CoA transferase
VADISAGMYASGGVCGPCCARNRRGSALEVSLFESLGEWMSSGLLRLQRRPPRSGRARVIAPYGPYAAGDGGIVYLGLQNEREWGRFCAEALGRPEVAIDPRFSSNPQRVKHRDELDAIITNAFSGLTADEVIDRLESAQIANARMNTVEEFMDHPQLAARNRWTEVASPAGPVRTLVPPFNFDNMEMPMGAIPAVGEHTDTILGELGFDGDTIARMHQSGIV